MKEAAPKGKFKSETPTSATNPKETRTLAVPATAPKHKEYESSVFRSKKFLSYFLSDLLWKGLLAYMIFTWQHGYTGQDLMLTTVLASTVVQCVYLVSQSWVDRAVRLAKITSKTAK